MVPLRTFNIRRTFLSYKKVLFGEKGFTIKIFLERDGSLTK